MEKAKKEKLKLTNFKTTSAERKRLKKLAKKYAGGNVSKWVKMRALPAVKAKKAA